jgi:IS5 family transposase
MRPLGGEPVFPVLLRGSGVPARGYTHAHQFKRARRELKFLRTRLGRIIRDIPEVECLGKGKARAPYEFGCKVSIVTPVTASKGGQFVLHAKALHGNPYDGHTLGPVIADLETLTGVAVHRICGDKGYRGHNYSDSVQGLDQRPGPPGHQSHPPQDAPPRCRRARDRPSQG